MMDKFLFASDLDNTLLFSYKHRKEKDVCIEYLRGKEQTFMSPAAIAMLAQTNEKSRFVPVTSRSIEEYLRIDFPPQCVPEYAVTTNGAILLQNGKIDEKWKEESLQMIAPWIEEMTRMLAVLNEFNEIQRCYIIDGMYLFAKCENALQAQMVQESIQHKTTLSMQVVKRKMYFFPTPISKGMAIKRLRQRFSPDVIIAAGDTSIDLSMLEEADIAFLPQDLWEQSEPLAQCFVWDYEHEFSEFILDKVLSKIIL